MALLGAHLSGVWLLGCMEHLPGAQASWGWNVLDVQRQVIAGALAQDGEKTASES